MVLLLAGGLSALQTAAIASALPFSAAILAAIWGFIRALRIDQAKRETLVNGRVGPAGGVSSSDWRKRLHSLLDDPTEEEVRVFIADTVAVAMAEFTAELNAKGLEADTAVDQNGERAYINVGHDQPFHYEVRARRHMRPIDDAAPSSGEYFRAEVHLSEGSQDYDLKGWSKDQVLHDLLEQYEKHLYFLHQVN